MKIKLKDFTGGLLMLSGVFFSTGANCQEDINRLSLEKVIEIARSQSPDALDAKHSFKGSYWEYKSYKAGLLPSLSLDATLPNFNSGFIAVTQNDGTVVFARQNNMNSSAGLSLTQNIGLTGGTIFVSSGLQRIDQLSGDKSTSYMSTPFRIGFDQPLFGYNENKWQRKTAPLKYKAALRQYVMDLENISYTATRYYFNLLLAQMNIEINTINYRNNDTLYKISQGRYNLGRIAESELLQMELNVLNSDAKLEQSKIDFESALFRFRSYLGLDAGQRIELIPPMQAHKLKIDVQKALEQAKQNRPELLDYERQLIEAASNVAKVRSDNRFNAKLYGVYGLTQSADYFDDVYKDPINDQQVMIGVSVPILDWGVGRGKVKMAESSKELVENDITQRRIDFEQQIYMKVMAFNMLESQLNIAMKADEIAQKRYEVSRQRYLIGRIDILELNVALQEKDQAKQSYLSALRLYWESYYEMRQLTLYDFLNDLPLEAIVEDI